MTEIVKLACCFCYIFFQGRNSRNYQVIQFREGSHISSFIYSSSSLLCVSANFWTGSFIFPLDQNLGLLSERVGGDKSTRLIKRCEWSKGEEINALRLKSCRCVSLWSPGSLLPAEFPWRRLCTLVPRPVHQPLFRRLHTRQWRWIMPMRADFSAVLTGSIFPLLAPGWMFLSNVSAQRWVAQRSANSGKAFN